MGYAVAQLVEALRYKPEGRGFDPRWCHWNFSLTQSFRPLYGPGVDSASNRNEYQEYFLGVKAADASGWQPYHLHVPTVLKSGSLIFLEPSGPAQACNGIALPLPFYLLNAGVRILNTLWNLCYRFRGTMTCLSTKYCKVYLGQGKEPAWVVIDRHLLWP